MHVFDIDSPEILDALEALDKLENRFSELVHAAAARRVLPAGKVCEMLGISRRTLLRYREEGLIKFSQVGKKTAFKLEHILEFLERHEWKG